MLRICLATVFVSAAVSLPVSGRAAAGAEGLKWQLPAVSDPAIQDRCDRLYTATQRLARHLLRDVHPWEDDPRLMLMTESRSGEHHIRPNTGLLAGLAFLYRFGSYDDGLVGLSRAELLETKILPVARYLTTTHVTGSRPTSDGKKWGDAWQSAQWANALGLAAWWLDDALPDDLATDVRRVVAHEAGRFVAADPPHQIKNDTKAEENAWNSTIFSAAVLLMPDDPRRPRWEAAFQKWALSAWLRPADHRSSAMVDGRPVSEQFTGANIHDDFTLENHNIVHPDYMTTWSLTLGCSLDYAMTGRRSPEALRFNADGIYENLKWFNLPDGGFIYPSGQDWTLYRHVDWLYPHIVMAVFGRDAEAWPLADQCLEVLEKMQARTSSGTIYLPNENSFASAQSDRMKASALAWLSLHFAKPGEPGDPARRGVRRLESARIILNRTPTAVHALSWNTRVMAQCVPLRKDRLVSPHPASGVGTIRLKAGGKPLPIKVLDVSVDDTADSFSAELVLDHGQAVRSRLHFDSRPDGTWRVRERLAALQDVTTSEIATGLIGVLNDRRWIYQRGERKLSLDGQARTVAACSGELISGEARRIDIDSALHINSESPLRVRYHAATAPERGRATDELVLNCIEGERHWQAGQTISEYEATIRCAPER